MSGVHSRLQVRIEIRINVLGDVSRHLHGCRGNRTWDWLLVVLFEPLDQLVHAAVDLVPIPEPVRYDSHVLHLWFLCRLIGQDKLAGIFLGNTKKVRNSFRILLPLLSKKFLKCFLVTSTSSSVTLVRE